MVFVITIMILILTTEFPLGCLDLLSGVTGESYVRSYYVPLLDLFGVVVLLVYPANIYLSCSMCKTYRELFCVYFVNRKQQRATIV